MSPQHFSKFTPIAKDLRYYRLLALTAGTGWFITLITLLIYWPLDISLSPTMLGMYYK